MSLLLLVTLALAACVVRMRFQPSKVRALFDARAWTETPFLLWAAYLFSSLLGLYVPSFYIQQYGTTIMSEELAFYLLPVLNSGSFFGRIVSTLTDQQLAIRARLMWYSFLCTRLTSWVR